MLIGTCVDNQSSGWGLYLSPGRLLEVGLMFRPSQLLEWRLFLCLFCFLFFRGRTLGYFETESLSTACWTISVSMTSDVSESSAADTLDFGEGKVPSMESSCIPCSSSEETVLVSWSGRCERSYHQYSWLCNEGLVDLLDVCEAKYRPREVTVVFVGLWEWIP